MLAKLVSTLDVLSARAGPGWASARPGTTRRPRPRPALPADQGALRAAGGGAADLPADVERRRRPLRRAALQARPHAQRPAAAAAPAPADPDRRQRGEEDAAPGRAVRPGLQPVRRARTLERKLDVLRGHCEAVGRDYDEIEKTVMVPLDLGERGEKIDACCPAAVDWPSSASQEAHGWVPRVLGAGRAGAVRQGGRAGRRARCDRRTDLSRIAPNRGRPRPVCPVVGTVARAEPSARENDDSVDGLRRADQPDRGQRAGGDGGQPGPQHRPPGHAGRRAQPDGRPHQGVHGGLRRRGRVHRRRDASRTSSPRWSGRAGSSSWSRPASRWTR